MTIEDMKNQLAEQVFLTKPSAWVNGVGIGLMPDDDRAPSQLNAAQRVLVFIDPAAPDCEKDAIDKEAKSKAGNQYQLVPCGPFVGLQASTGESISYFAPFRYNLPRASVGTFGAMVKGGGKQYILTSNHVLAHNGRAPVGTDVVAPGTQDAIAGDLIGSVSHVVEFNPPSWPLVRPSRGQANTVDCALAEISPTTAVSANTQVSQLLDPPPILTSVTKIGRTTGLTQSTIRLLNWEGWISFSFGDYYFEELMGTIGPDEFAKPGDSGSLALTPAGEGIGLVTARAYIFDSSGQLDGYIILICSLVSVRKALSAASVLGIPPDQIEFWRD